MKINPAEVSQHTASFRDPSGFIYTKAGRLLRQINPSASEDFSLLNESGLYKALTDKQHLIPHTIASDIKTKGAHITIEPQKLPFISYPFEWSFSQLKDAALLTLTVQKMALKHGMVLKDASAYNVQFHNGKPIFIDTLSFEKYTEGQPWNGYRQFCQHFLAPLALMTYTDQSLSQLSRVHLDGIPLELAAKLLPKKARLRLGLTAHLFMHAKAQTSKAKEHTRQQVHVSQQQLLAIIDNLERTIKKLQPLRYETEWGNYYSNTNYSMDAADEKAQVIEAYVKSLSVKTVLDIGGNNGQYSRPLNNLDIFTVCSDIDVNAVEANYRFVRKNQEDHMLPVLIDFTNPGGYLGWANEERQPIHERYQTDLVMALAIVHHLAISNNLPLEHVAGYIKKFAPLLIIEFVPKEDSQVQKLLATREDIFPDYTEKGFEKAFSTHFTLKERTRIAGTERTLYLFKRK